MKLILISTVLIIGASACEPGKPAAWPPREGKTYPDLQLKNHRGEDVSIDSFRGKVVFIELIGIPCRGCVAFAGGHKYGPFENIAPQDGLGDIDKYFRRLTKGVRLDDDRVAFVQILFYGLDMNAPTVDDARKWAEHFRLDQQDNCHVLAGTQAFISPEKRGMIPGFHLLDKGGVLRCDATGRSQGDLYNKLLPMVPKLLKEKAPSVQAGF